MSRRTTYWVTLAVSLLPPRPGPSSRVRRSATRQESSPARRALGRRAAALGRAQRRPAVDIVDGDQAGQHGHELAALCRSERGQDAALGGIDRAGDRIERGAAERRRIEKLGAPVGGSGTAGDELLGLEPRYDVADR